MVKRIVFGDGDTDPAEFIRALLAEPEPDPESVTPDPDTEPQEESQ